MLTKVIKFGVLFFIILSGCNKSPVSDQPLSPASERISKAALFSDEDIFRAIIFLDGPATQGIEDFNDYSLSALTKDPKKIREVNAIRNTILGRIQQQQPGYLKAFRSEIESGDYTRVKAALFNAAELTFKVTAQIINIPEADLQKSISVIADEFAVKNNLDYKSAKSAYLNAVHQQIGTCSDIVVLICGVILANTSVIVNTAFIVVRSASGGFSSYESERFTSLVTLNYARHF